MSQPGDRVVLKQSAIEHLLADPMIRRWRRDEADRRTPFLGYYRRSYFTANDGTVIEHGDGFCLTFVDLDDPDVTRGLVTKSVPVASGFDILVGADEATMSRSFAIGWSHKYTHEPQSSG